MRQRSLYNHNTLGFLLLSLAASVLSFSESSFAASLNRPDWTEQAMFRFSGDVFFVGEASCAKTSEEGRQRAFTQGMQEILNYTQSTSLEGLPVNTQMIFEDIADPRCPPHTITVWRLLRADSEILAHVLSRHRGNKTVPSFEDGSSPDPFLRVGLQRREVLHDLGRPLSIDFRPDGSSVWDYQSLMLYFGRTGQLAEWQSTKTRSSGGRSTQASADRTLRLSQSETPVLMLSDESVLPPLNIVYNGERFTRPKVVFSQWGGAWPACTVLDQAEVVAQLREEFLAQAYWIPQPSTPWNAPPQSSRYSKPRISGLWTCQEGLLSPSHPDCRPKFLD